LGSPREVAEARCRVATGLSILSAGTPMFLMGEEIAAQKPFIHNGVVEGKEDLAGERAGWGARMFSFLSGSHPPAARREGQRRPRVVVVRPRCHCQVGGVEDASKYRGGRIESLCVPNGISVKLSSNGPLMSRLDGPFLFALRIGWPPLRQAAPLHTRPTLARTRWSLLAQPDSQKRLGALRYPPADAPSAR
jgi:hypothetical protein